MLFKVKNCNWIKNDKTQLPEQLFWETTTELVVGVGFGGGEIWFDLISVGDTDMTPEDLPASRARSGQIK